MREERLGLTHARVRGFAEARGALVSWVEDDNLIAPDWLAGVVEVMGARPEAAVRRLQRACARLRRGRRGGWSAWDGHSPAALRARRGDITEDRGFLWGAGLTVRGPRPGATWSSTAGGRCWVDRRGGAGYGVGWGHGAVPGPAAQRLAAALRATPAAAPCPPGSSPELALCTPLAAGLWRFHSWPYRHALGLPTPSGWAPEARALARDLVRSAPAALRARGGDGSVFGNSRSAASASSCVYAAPTIAGWLRSRTRPGGASFPASRRSRSVWRRRSKPGAWMREYPFPWRSAGSRCVVPGRSCARPWRGWGRRRRSRARRWRGAPLPCCFLAIGVVQLRGGHRRLRLRRFRAAQPLTWRTKPTPILVNLVALLIYVAAALLVGFFVGFRRLRPVREWLKEDRQPTDGGAAARAALAGATRG